MTRSRTYEKIKATAQLPSPDGHALRISRLAHDERTTIQDLATVIEEDPAITSRLLQYVNSPLAGVSRQIASVRQAVALLGLLTVKNIALGFSLVSQNKNGPCAGFDYEFFWSESVARAVTARHLACRFECFSPDEVFTCGLLCQIGRLAFATAFPHSYASVLGLAEADDSDRLIDIEHKMFELNHNELSAEMMMDWRMPNLFCDAVRLQDSDDLADLDENSHTTQLARILHLAGAVSVILLYSSIQRESMASVGTEACRLGIGVGEIGEAFDSISAEWRTVGALVEVGTRRVASWNEIYKEAYY